MALGTRDLELFASLIPDSAAKRGSMEPVDISNAVNSMRPPLGRYEELYRHLHQNPELSGQEEQTARTIVQELATISGYDVLEGVGGHGVVAVLRNGHGKTVWLRADTDALPVEEKTGLEYASRRSMTDVQDGLTKPVMHACGHDMHVACLLGAAEGLARAREFWKGTVVLIFQPDEERGGGAQAMVEAGLYERVPRPDVILGQHLMPFEAGHVGTRRGYVASAADSFRVRLFGRGGHASQPHRTADPVLMAAHIIVRLQSIVSRQAPPAESTVITVGSVHAGRTSNVIPDEAVIELTVRTMHPATRDKVLGAIESIVRAECRASGAPAEPDMARLVQLPLMRNDVDVTRHLEDRFGAHFGERCYSAEALPLGGSEDFPNLAAPHAVPYCFWTFGGVDPAQWAEAERKGTLAQDIPSNHSPFFAPVIQPTLKTGVDGLLVGAMAFLAR